VGPLRLLSISVLTSVPTNLNKISNKKKQTNVENETINFENRGNA
jgi:hypothetical protein